MAYCTKHFIRYCSELSKECPYCRIAELERERDLLEGALELESLRVDEHAAILHGIATFWRKKMMVEDLKNELGNLLYGMTPSEAIEQGVCIRCKEPPKFKTPAGEREYQLSGMCEYCFDEEFADL